MELRKKVRNVLSQKKKIGVRSQVYKTVRHRNTFKESKMYDTRITFRSRKRRFLCFGEKGDPFVWNKEIKKVPKLYKKGYRNFLQVKNLRSRRMWNIPVVELSSNDERRQLVVYKAFVLWLCQKNVLENALKNIPSTYFISQKRLIGGKYDKIWNQSSPFDVEIAPLRHLDINSFKDWRKWLYKLNLTKIFSSEYHMDHFGPEEGKQVDLLDDNDFFSLLTMRIPSHKFWKKVQDIHNKDVLKKFNENFSCSLTELRNLYRRRKHIQYDEDENYDFSSKPVLPLKQILNRYRKCFLRKEKLKK